MSNAIAAALAAGDQARVVSLYEEAAVVKEADGHIDAACFLFTHAWIHALEAGDSRAGELRARLIAHGRESET